MRVVTKPAISKVPAIFTPRHAFVIPYPVQQVPLGSSNGAVAIYHYQQHFILKSNHNKTHFQKLEGMFQQQPWVQPQPPKGPNKDQQRKKLNLGRCVETLQMEIPDILTTLISSDLISSDIIFRICPNTHDKIPVFKGYVPYVTTAKTLQLCLTQFVLNPNVKVHILNTKVADAEATTSNYGLYKNTSKIIMNWRTCHDNCPHLTENNEETSLSSKGKHTWSQLDLTKLQTISENFGLMNLKLTDDKIERILSGIFVFELDEWNEKIKVLTIEDVEILEHKEWIPTAPNGAAC